MWAPGSGSGDKTTMRLLIIKIFIPAASIYSVNSGIAKKDNVGLAYAIMNGGNLSLDKSQVLEVYYRLVLNDYLGDPGIYFNFTAGLSYAGQIGTGD